MVYDFFKRRTTPPAEPSTDPAARDEAEQAVRQDPQPPAESPAQASAAESAAAPPAAPPTPRASSGVSSGRSPAPGAADTAALEWAKAAYARLKAQQEARKQAAATAPPSESVAAPSAPAVLSGDSPVAEQRPAPGGTPSAVSGTAVVPTASHPPSPAVAEGEQVAELPPTVDPAPAPPTPPQPPGTGSAEGLGLLARATAERSRRQAEMEAAARLTTPAQPASDASDTSDASEASASELELGAFDRDFAWSAEVLAAQGRGADQVSLEDIDWLGRLRRGMEKTRRGFVTRLLETLGDDPLTPGQLDDLEALLLQADVGVEATDRVLGALRSRLNEEVVDPEEGLGFLKEKLCELLEQPIRDSGADLLVPQRGRLNVWLMVGVNGVGKTTTLGKLANLAVRSGYSSLIAAADTFRAGAVKQVAIWGERSAVPVVANPSENADPAAVVFDAVGAARSRGTELLLVDTAGRLQTKHNLMEELAKVRGIVDRLAPDAVVESLLVLDASQGQNGLRQAQAFAIAAGLTGVVLTKLDGSSKGGVAFAVASEAGLPIRFIGAGEGIRDLRPFNSFEFVEALLAR
ncbi:MAG: signal recognition particle-docking protein FtsY [Aphanocapsa feldmannii 288cV]|nr:MAG: signal recognition particle-docking protein FtsY [Aphanocapsa feldmannii 288cV]